VVSVFLVFETKILYAHTTFRKVEHPSVHFIFFYLTKERGKKRGDRQTRKKN